MRLRNAVISGFVLALTPLLLSGCDLATFVPNKGDTSDTQDRQQGLSRNDFRDLNKADKLLPEDEKDVSAAVGAPPIPDLAQVLAVPRAPKVGNTKLVTLSVTEDVPLRDVLFELGRLANVDIEVGPGLETQGVNLRATDRPFNEVIDRLATLGNLRYSVEGNSIRVERDTPYIKNYTLDFLNTVRSSTNSYTLSTSILSSGGGSSGGGSGGGSSVGTSGSSSGITATSDSDLWTSLEASITEILSYTADGSAGGAAGGDAAAAAPAAAGGAAGGGAPSAGGFVVNRQAGILSVNATERQHEMVQRFLTMITRNAAAQVLIEAKIVEVSLSNQFLSGINWNEVLGNLNNDYITLGKYSPATLSTHSLTPGLNGNSITFGVNNGSLDAVLSATERFGTTRTLSSPRLSAINNQQAILTFAQNQVFFDCEVTASTTTSTTSTSVTAPPTVDCTANTVPIGIILNILPSVNLDTQEVTLSVRPTLTRHVGDAINPETQYIQSLINAAASSSGGAAVTVPDISVPIIEVREIDSVMKVKTGGVMVIGGLMEDQTSSTQVGIPGAMDVPLVGNLFKSRSEDMGKRELIIFIKATIINSDGSATPIDRSIMKKYTTDPRPLFK